MRRVSYRACASRVSEVGHPVGCRCDTQVDVSAVAIKKALGAFNVPVATATTRHRGLGHMSKGSISSPLQKAFIMRRQWHRRGDRSTEHADKSLFCHSPITNHQSHNSSRRVTQLDNQQKAPHQIAPGPSQRLHDRGG